MDDARPKKRWECKLGDRPCPWIGCRYNLVEIRVDVFGNAYLAGSAHQVEDEEILDRLDEFIESGESNCALDHVRKAPYTLDKIGGLLGTTREMIRQNEGQAIRKAKRQAKRMGVTELCLETLSMMEEARNDRETDEP